RATLAAIAPAVNSPAGDGRAPARAAASGQLEDAGAPARAAEVAALARVAARTAVAGADATVAVAARMHAVEQFLAPALEPVGAADARRVLPAPDGFGLAVVAEVLVGVELVLEVARAQLDHDRVVEVAEHRHRVGDH